MVGDPEEVRLDPLRFSIEKKPGSGTDPRKRPGLFLKYGSGFADLLLFMLYCSLDIFKAYVRIGTTQVLAIKTAKKLTL